MMIKEKQRTTMSGIAMLVILLAVMLADGASLILVLVQQPLGIAGAILIRSVILVLSIIGLTGLFTVQPNQGVVLQLFGRYVGTVGAPGLRWANPFYSKRPVSLRVRNFETSKMKVNDHDGNPIEIAAVVVWKVIDTAEAVFQVDDYEDYVRVQSESAVRNMATAYPYDSHTEGQMSLRSHTTEIARHLKKEVQERLLVAGVEVTEARISHLAYAPEIAAAMLQRQQASAIIAARQKIVEGAVGMVEMALAKLKEHDVVDLDGERRAAMVSNLLVVLCGERATQPVVNTGAS